MPLAETTVQTIAGEENQTGQLAYLHEPWLIHARRSGFSGRVKGHLETRCSGSLATASAGFPLPSA